MKTRLPQLACFALCLFPLSQLFAQDPDFPPPDPQKSAHFRPPEQLDQLFGPIALYPDALIALILPAATVPSDIVLAERYLDSNGDPSKADDLNWDDSVKALVHYPDVVKWMDENLAWTKQAGEAFSVQPADVMNAIQRLRARARAAGTLTDTPQQQVVMEEDNISIVPAEPDVIYVPRYDPEVVYVSHPGFYNDPFLTFGAGYATGFWLGYDFDWGRRRIWTIDRRDREQYWNERHDWRRPAFPGRPGYADDHFHHQTWQPHPDYSRGHSPTVNHPPREVIRPAPFGNGGQVRGQEVRRGGADSRPDNQDRRRNADAHDSSSRHRPENSSAPAVNVTPQPAQVTQPSFPSNSRVTPATSVPVAPRNQANREEHRHDRQEGRTNETSPARAAPAQSTPPPRTETAPVTQSRPLQITPTSQPRPVPAAPAAKGDKDDNRSDRVQRQ